MSESREVLAYASRGEGNSRVRSAAWIVLLVIGCLTVMFGIAVGAFGAFVTLLAVMWSPEKVFFFALAMLLGGVPVLLGIFEVVCALKVQRRVKIAAEAGLSLVSLEALLVILVGACTQSTEMMPTLRGSNLLVGICTMVILLLAVEGVLLIRVLVEHRRVAAVERSSA